MKKILKNKNIIAFILVFTLSFGVVSSYNTKKVEAFDFVITPTILWVLGSIAITTGLVVVNREQVTDLGGKIADSIDDWSKVFDDGKIKLNSYLLDKIVNVVANLLNNEVAIRTDFGSVDLVLNGFSVWDSNYFSNAYGFDNAYKNRETQKLIFDVDITKANKIYLDSISYTLPVGVDYILYGQQYNRYYESATPYVLFVYIPKSADSTGTIPSSVGSYNGYVIKKSTDLITTFPLDLGGAGVKVKTELPYGEETFKENFNPIPSKELPFDNSLSIPIPTDVPDVAVSTDIPLNKENVFEKGGIHTIPNENILEHEGTIEDVPGAEIPESLSIWNWLKALIMAIINFLKAILSALVGAITSLLTGILDILKALANLIINGIKALFMPTVAIADLFIIPATSGFSDIVNFLNWDSLWGITPIPIEFKTNLLRSGVGVETTRNWFIEFKPFEIPFIKSNLNTIRNVMSYSCLLTVMWSIVRHMLPKRDMD